MRRSLAIFLIVCVYGCRGEDERCHLRAETQFETNLVVLTPDENGFVGHVRITDTTLALVSVNGATYHFTEPATLKEYNLTLYNIHTHPPFTPEKSYYVISRSEFGYPGVFNLKMADDQGLLFFGVSSIESQGQEDGITIQRSLQTPCEKTSVKGCYNVKNTPVVFKCGNNALELYQSQEGTISCNGKNFLAYVFIGLLKEVIPSCFQQDGGFNELSFTLVRSSPTPL